MSAPKRKRFLFLSPRRKPDPPASFKRRVLDYAGAKDALEKLTSEELNENMLWRHLWGLASLAYKDKRQGTRWLDLTDWPTYALRRFPDRVRSMADQVEDLEGKIRSNQVYAGTSRFLPFFLAGAIPKAEVEVRRGDDVLLRNVGTETRAISAERASNLLEKQGELPKLTELPKLLRLYADYTRSRAIKYWLLSCVFHENE